MNTWMEPRSGGVALIDHLFNRLDGLYPHRWRSAFANAQAIANWRDAWAEGLTEEGISPEEVKHGLDECRRRIDWPPSFAEFIKACRPAVDCEQSFLEAVTQMQRRQEGKDEWSHPAIYWAAATIGRFDLQHATCGNMKARWAATLKTEMDKREWPEIPPHHEALPAPGQCSVTRDEARKRLAAIRDQLLMKDERASQNALEAERLAYLEGGEW